MLAVDGPEVMLSWRRLFSRQFVGYADVAMSASLQCHKYVPYLTEQYLQ